MIPTKAKQKIIEKHKTHDKDTGSSEVQIAILNEQIARLTDHLKEFKKDNHSRHGLLKMVAKRKTLLEYLSKGDQEKLQELRRRFGLKK